MVVEGCSEELKPILKWLGDAVLLASANFYSIT